MRAAEQAAFNRGAAVEALMDRAGAGVARTVRQFFPSSGTCVVYVGKGHNAGDALVAAADLRAAGWQVEVKLAFPERDLSELTCRKLHAFRTTAELAPPCPQSRLVILDGLLGLGAKSQLREPIQTAAREINHRRTEQSAFVFAVDLPTGLDGDSGERDVDCVKADCTVTIGFPKRGLLADEALDFVGRLEVVRLPDLRVEPNHETETVTTADSLRHLLPPREFSAYKNLFGRIGVVAGSEGFWGAAILATKGALRSGAGLVNMFVPRELYSTVAALSPDEAMVKPVQSYTDLLGQQNVDVWAIGPGLGTGRANELLALIEKTEKPVVLDADGLNIVAQKIEVLNRCRGRRLLTPHPGEMKRLFGHGAMSRADIARRFCDTYSATLLFKGSRTIACEKGHRVAYNSTGNPGMATGGMGDVLTGVCAGLVAQRLSLYDAARLGAWICGRAAEIAIFESGQSEESLLPTDLIAQLGPAFNDLRQSGSNVQSNR
jgi:NAD(P)H-hydrate epimerase